MDEISEIFVIEHLSLSNKLKPCFENNTIRHFNIIIPFLIHDSMKEHTIKMIDF